MLSIDWLIKRLVKAGATVCYHARRWYVHVASGFSLAHHYRAVLGWGPLAYQMDRIWSMRDWYARNLEKLTLIPGLCYFGAYGRDLLREVDRLGVFTQSKRLKNYFGTTAAEAAA